MSRRNPKNEIERAYYKARHAAISAKSYYKAQGIDVSGFVIPAIPKKITAGSVRRMKQAAETMRKGLQKEAKQQRRERDERARQAWREYEARLEKEAEAVTIIANFMAIAEDAIFSDMISPFARAKARILRRYIAQRQVELGPIELADRMETHAYYLTKAMERLIYASDQDTVDQMPWGEAWLAIKSYIGDSQDAEAMKRWEAQLNEIAEQESQEIPFDEFYE